MQYKNLVIILIINLMFPLLIKAQPISGTIKGVVFSSGKPLPFANVGISGTTLGAVTNENGQFEITGLRTGNHELRVSFIGYLEFYKSVLLTDKNPVVELSLSIKQLSKALDEIVVTGTRNEKRRIDSAVPVNILDSRIMESTQSLNLAEGLSFQPGIRIEKDCQTCNYTQVRMNGLPGSYTQILINSRALFSSLAGLYGLEQLPASMIERVEIVKGGGSVLYGSSAVAGTINIITKDPTEYGLQMQSTSSLIKSDAFDNQSDLYASAINRKKNAGSSVLISHRNRESWDANKDGFSELAAFKNISFGVNTFINPDTDSKIRISMNSINEIRNGGDQLNREPHLRMQSEFRDSRILAGNIDYTYNFYNIRSKLELYSGGQSTIREHYTGAFGADGYGTTKNQTVIAGIQFSHTVLNFISGKNLFTTGYEYQYDYVNDAIKAYQYLINQETFQNGLFLQSDWEIHPKLNLLSGIRISTHNKSEKNVVSPRINLLYKFNSKLQARISRSSGFRAPQAFDTDMHIAFSGGGVALTAIDPQLQPEYSTSYSFSADYNVPRQKYIYGFTVAAFYTQIRNTFILEEQPAEPNSTNTILFRTNGSNATVKGITLETRFNFNYKVEAEFGFNFQESQYEHAVAWSAEIPGIKQFLRTPSTYGYFAASFTLTRDMKYSLSGVFTGPMNIAHFAGAPGVNQDELIQSSSFMELNTKLDYQLPLNSKQFKMTVSGGIQNLLNAFQNDFDAGPYRDSNYIYGPGRPKTLFFSIKIGIIGRDK